VLNVSPLGCGAPPLPLLSKLTVPSIVNEEVENVTSRET